jgi:O-antigen ligase
VGHAPCNTHPHNFYAQLAAETGIIGLSFLIVVSIFFIILIFKHIYISLFFKRQFLSDYKLCLLAGLLITIWPLTTNGNFFNNHLMLFYSLQMGFFKKNFETLK